MGRRQDEDDDDSGREPEPVELPITEELDLHTFRPGDVKRLIGDYIDACVAKGFSEVRIVHGKGTGTLRELVHKTLDRCPFVSSYSLAPGERGGWGATIVMLQRGKRRR